MLWAVTAALLGVVERLTDPKTCHGVWVWTWCTAETATTVRRGDAVPDQTISDSLATAESKTCPVGDTKFRHQV